MNPSNQPIIKADSKLKHKVLSSAYMAWETEDKLSFRDWAQFTTCLLVAYLLVSSQFPSNKNFSNQPQTMAQLQDRAYTELFYPETLQRHHDIILQNLLPEITQSY